MPTATPKVAEQATLSPESVGQDVDSLRSGCQIALSTAVTSLAGRSTRSPDGNSQSDEESCRSSPERATLLNEGFLVVKDVLPRVQLDALRAYAASQLENQANPEFTKCFSHGTMLPVDATDEGIQRLVLTAIRCQIFNRLEFRSVKWMSGYIIDKPPASPPLWWHQDWWAWDEPCSASPIPPQLFVIYYLVDTSPENGCLRVIPKSHRKRIDLHTDLPEAHSNEIESAQHNSIAYSRHPNEIDVPVRAGDAIVGDVRLLHATHANNSNTNRTCVTLWYITEYESLSSPLQRHISLHPCIPDDVTLHSSRSTLWKELACYIPRFTATAEDVHFNRIPRPEYLEDVTV